MNRWNTFLWTHLQSFYLKLLPAHLYSSRCDVSVRIERMARYIMDDFGDNNIMVLCVLKGGYKFCADLVEFIKVLGRNSNKYLETRVEFIRLKSYLVGVLTRCHTQWTRFRARPLFWGFFSEIIADQISTVGPAEFVSVAAWCLECFRDESWLTASPVWVQPGIFAASYSQLFQRNFSHKKMQKNNKNKTTTKHFIGVFPFCETIMRCWNDSSTFNKSFI